MVRKKPRTNDESPASPSADEGASDGAPELTMLSADGTPDLAVILTAISDMSKKMDDGFQALEGTDTSILNTLEEAKRFADNMPGRSVAPV
ncbi:unnamed protein product [Gadus morhua 'NCC']